MDSVYNMEQAALWFRQHYPNDIGDGVLCKRNMQEGPKELICKTLAQAEQFYAECELC